jgi:hypothetical protein
LLILTIVNFGMIAFQLTRLPFVTGVGGNGILRGQGIEIVDGEGRLRAQLKVEAANPGYRMPDGTTHIPPDYTGRKTARQVDVQ